MDDRKVWTTEDFENVYEGSCIYVQEEFEFEDEPGVLYYGGMWSSMAGTYYVSVPASICTDVDPDEEMRKQICAWMDTPEGKASLERFKNMKRFTDV